MEKQKFFNIFVFEFKASISITLKKMMFLFGLALIFSINFFKRANDLSYSPGVGDCFLYIMKGNDIYIPRPGIPFEIPIMWFLIHLTIFFIIVDYANTTFHILGRQSFVKIKNRNYWWYSKCMVCLCVSILSYITIVLAMLLVSACYGNVSFKINREIAEVVSDIHFEKNSTTMSIWIACVMVPMFTVFVLGIIQIIISLFGRAIYGYLLVCIYLTASTYYCDYQIFIGNFMIPIRNKVMNHGRYNSILALGVDMCLLFLMFYIGKIFIRIYEVK